MVLIMEYPLFIAHPIDRMLYLTYRSQGLLADRNSTPAKSTV